MKNLQSTTELREFEVDFPNTSATQQLIADQQILTIQSPLDVNKIVVNREGPQVRKTLPGRSDRSSQIPDQRWNRLSGVNRP